MLSLGSQLFIITGPGRPPLFISLSYFIAIFMPISILPSKNVPIVYVILYVLLRNVFFCALVFLFS